MTIVPRLMASFSSFRRIQDYIREPVHRDGRLPPLSSGTILPSFKTAHQTAIELKDATLIFPGSTSPTLLNVNLNIQRGSVVICSGRSGSGKTSLGLIIAGEISLTEGTILCNTKRVGLCSQIPWLPEGKLHEMIQGSAHESDMNDVVWYHEVLEACCLDSHADSPPEIDSSRRHSSNKLSGGQRQRIVCRSSFDYDDLLTFSGIGASGLPSMRNLGAG